MYLVPLTTNSPTPDTVNCYKLIFLFHFLIQMEGSRRQGQLEDNSAISYDKLRAC